MYDGQVKQGKLPNGLNFWSNRLIVLGNKDTSGSQTRGRDPLESHQISKDIFTSRRSKDSFEVLRYFIDNFGG